MAEIEKTRAGFDEVVSQLRATNILLTALMARGAKFKQQEVVVLLAQARLSGAEIAAITGTTLNTVQVTLSRYRRKSKHSETERE